MKTIISSIYLFLRSRFFNIFLSPIQRYHKYFIYSAFINSQNIANVAANIKSAFWILLMVDILFYIFNLLVSLAHLCFKLLEHLFEIILNFLLNEFNFYSVNFYRKFILICISKKANLCQSLKSLFNIFLIELTKMHITTIIGVIRVSGNTTVFVIRISFIYSDLFFYNSIKL